MSIFKNVKKKMFNFNSSGSSSSGSKAISKIKRFSKEDILDEVPKRDLSKITRDDIDLSVRNASSSAVSLNKSQQLKKKPSSYQFLVNTNPFIDWSETAIEEDNRYSEENETEYIEKLMKKNDSELLASAKVYDRFNDDYFDNYLYEIGILSDFHLKFEDHMLHIELLRECSHKNVSKFYNSYFHDQKLWILSEYFPGGSIEKLMFDLERPFTLNQIHFICKEVLDALCYLHDSCKIVHRDVRAKNLYICSDGAIKLGNFELSKRCDQEDNKKYYFIRSPHWTAPEVCDPIYNMYNNPKSDIWSMGITCIELAEMFPPLSSLNPDAVVDIIHFLSVSPALNNDLFKWPANYIDFVSNCLNLNYTTRPNASDLLKHDFIKSMNTSKKEIHDLLTERREKLLAKAKNAVDDSEKYFKTINQMEEQPELFVHSYFQELKNLVDLKAEEAKQKIENDQMGIINMLNYYEETCIQNKNPKSLNENIPIEELTEKFSKNISSWSKKLEKKDQVSETSLRKIEKEANSLNEILLDRSKKLKSYLFSKKEFELSHIETETINFAQLVIQDIDKIQNRKTSLRNNSIVNIKKKKPISKIIKFEIKGTKKKTK